MFFTMNIFKNYHAVLIALCLLNIACVKESHSVNIGPSQEESSNYVELSLPNTSRIALGAKQGDEYPVYWTENDCIAVNGIASQSIEIDKEDARRAVFHFGDNTLKYPYSIIYPHSDINSVDEPKVTIPAVQSYVEGSFSMESVPMCGYVRSKNDKIAMRYLAGLLRF
jgi:hypothetical protein